MGFSSKQKPISPIRPSYTSSRPPLYSKQTLHKQTKSNKISPWVDFKSPSNTIKTHSQNIKYIATYLWKKKKTAGSWVIYPTKIQIRIGERLSFRIHQRACNVNKGVLFSWAFLTQNPPKKAGLLKERTGITAAIEYGFGGFFKDIWKSMKKTTERPGRKRILIWVGVKTFLCRCLWWGERERERHTTRD